MQKDARRLFILLHRRQPKSGQATVALVHLESLAGQANRRRQGATERQAPIIRGDVNQRRHLPRDAGGQGAGERQIRHHVTVVVEKHVPGGGKRRPLAPVHHDLEAVIAPVQQPEAAAAETGAVGFHHGQRGADRHRGIEGIAARGEDVHAGPGGERMGAGDGGGRRFLPATAGRDCQADRKQKDSRTEPSQAFHTG